MISDHGDPFARIGGEQAGGQNLYVKYLGETLVSRGYKVDVFTRWEDGNQVSVKKGLRVIRVKAGPVGFLSKDEFIKVLPEFVSNIKAEMQKRKYDIVHSHYWLSGLSAIALKEELGVPFVHTFHSLGAVKHNVMGIDNEKSKKREEGEKEIIDKCNWIVATSPQEVEDIKHFYKKSEDKLVVVPVGVDLRKFCFYSKHIARRKLGVHEDPIVLFVGRFEERKGLDTLIRAIGLIKKEVPNVKLWVIGGDSHKAGTGVETDEVVRVKNVIRETNTADNVEFIGRVPNFKLKKYYAAADVCCVPSYYEPFGIVPLESMATGTPVVASKVGGLQFSVDDGVTGYLAKPKDERQVADKISMILKDVNLRMELSSNAVENIAKHFSWEEVTTLCAKVYGNVVFGSELPLKSQRRVRLFEKSND